MEKTSSDNTDNPDSNLEKEEISSPGSPERREKKKVFFLTKSLAEVYAKQNHIAMALEIYRRMQEQNQVCPEIEKRMAELEDSLLAKRGVRFKETNT